MPPVFYLFAKSIYILLAEIEKGGRVEAAIDASALAKRNMYVNSCHIGHKITNLL